MTTVISGPGQPEIGKQLAELLFKLIFFREGLWGFISFIFFLFLIIVLITCIKKFNRVYREELEKTKESANREALDREVTWLTTFSNTIKRALGDN